MSKPSDETVELLALLDELRIIAENGLEFTEDPYDRERYNRLAELVEEYYGRTFAVPPAEVRSNLQDELGVVTPKVGATAVVVDESEQVLTMLRPNGEWCLPGGNADPGEAPEQTVRRETREETGLDVEVRELVDAYQLPSGSGYGPHGAVTLLYRCEAVSGELELSHEGWDLQWQSVEDVPRWFADHERYVREAVASEDGG